MKKVSLLLILVFSTLTISAQESGTSREAGRKATFARNGLWDNWFIGAGAGANMFFTKEDSHASFLKRPTLTGNGQVGKWFNPYLGARLKGTYGAVHTFVDNANRMHTQKAITGEVDVMFDVTNYLGKYNEDRLYSFIPYAGVGAIYSRGYTNMNGTNRNHEKSLTFNGGLINRFRLTDKLDLDVELSGILMNDAFDRRESKKYAYNLMGNASVNLVYKLGSKTGFSEALLMDQGQIDALNDEINRLKQENDALSRRPKDCPKCPEIPAQKVVEVNKGGMNSAIFFRLGSANIDKNQEGNIYHVAEYLKANSGAKVSVTGYADKKTGSTSINQRLSEKRAKKVADTLIKKYNIDSNRVKVEWKGDKEQPYSTNAWNRVAIVVGE